MSLVCPSYVNHMYSYVIRIYSYVIPMSLVCTSMPFVCHFYILVCTLMSSICHSYVLVYHSYVTRMSLVYTRMSSMCHSYVLLCHPYVTCMSFVCHPSVVLPWIFSDCIRVCFVCFGKLIKLIPYCHEVKKISVVIEISMSRK